MTLVVPDPCSTRCSFDDDTLPELALLGRSAQALAASHCRARRAPTAAIAFVWATGVSAHRSLPAVRQSRHHRDRGRTDLLLADKIVQDDQRNNLSSIELARGCPHAQKRHGSGRNLRLALLVQAVCLALYTAVVTSPPLTNALSRAPIRLLYDLHCVSRDCLTEIEADSKRARRNAGGGWIMAGLKGSAGGQRAAHPDHNGSRCPPRSACGTRFCCWIGGKGAAGLPSG